MTRQEYTPEQIGDFKLDKARIVCQNALAHATQIVLAVGQEREMRRDGYSVVAAVKLTAETLASWVYSHSHMLIENKPESVQTVLPNPDGTQKMSHSLNELTKPPQPTPQESVVLDEIYKQLDATKPVGMVVDRKRIIEIVWAKYGKFPQNKKSIDKIMHDVIFTTAIVKNDFLKGI